MMNRHEFDELLERVNQIRKVALKNADFIERAKEHAKEIQRETAITALPRKRCLKHTRAAPKLFSSVYEGLTSSGNDDFQY